MNARPVLLACVATALLLGCASAPPSFRGLDASSGQNIALFPKATPEAALSGVYRSPQLGLIHLDQQGNHVQGFFEYARGHAEVHGTLQGDAEGNLLRFDWHESHRSCEDTVSIGGHGYWLIDPPQGDQSRLRLFGHRDYVIVTDLPRGIHAVETRDGGPISAIRLDREPPARARTQDLSCAPTARK